jgi:hypothetical protein
LGGILRGIDKQSLDYGMVRFYFDGVENGVSQRVLNEPNKSIRGKYLYYMGLHYELLDNAAMAMRYYQQVVDESRPSFFEYRLAQSSLDALTGRTAKKQ